MLSPRFLTFRSLCLLVGCLFAIPFALAGGLFWIMYLHADWLADLESPLVFDISRRIYRVGLQRPATDSDDNGLPDWYERSLGRYSYFSSVRAHNKYIYAGERTQIRLKLDINGNYDEIAWPINAEVAITAPGPILLAAGSAAGTAPTAGPLRVKASPQGRIVFDVICYDDKDTEWLQITHARSGHQFTQNTERLIRVYGWRLPVHPSRIEARTSNYGAATPHLVWEPLPDPKIAYVLETALADPPLEWIGFHYNRPGDTPSMILDEETDQYTFPDHQSPLLYRVVPVSLEKPSSL